MHAPDGQTKAETILERAVCLTLRCHYLGNHRVVDIADVVKALRPDADPMIEFEAPEPGDLFAADAPAAPGIDKTSISTAKRLVDPKELRPANRVLGLVKSYLRRKAIPTPRVFGERSYLVPSALVREVNAQLKSYQAEIAAEGAALAGRYAAAVARQAVVLGPLFDARDYRTEAEVASAFAFNWDYVSFAAPDLLQSVDGALFDEARQRTDSRFESAYDEVRVVLRETLRQATDEMVRRLTPDADGKPKVLRSTALRDLTDFLGTFDLRNVTDDAELGAVVARLRAVTEGVDVDSLKDLGRVRSQVLAEVQAATDALGELVVKGRRAISLTGPQAA